MTNLPITELDFFANLEQFKDYLQKNQTKFKDYDFTGSNIRVLLEILAYNSYQNNFYTNMAIGEMFLDSALLESSILSHAKELNYLPKSARSAVAVIGLSVQGSLFPNNSNITLPKGTIFNTSFNGESYNFITQKTHTLSKNQLTQNFENDCIDIYEGITINEAFYLDENTNKIDLTNVDVDIRSVEVKVLTNNGMQDYVYKSNIYGIENEDTVFYMEPSLNGGYAITFGENVFGKRPSPSDVIYVSYRVCSGEKSNNASRFTGGQFSFNNVNVSPTIFIKENATGGSDKENIESVKFFAPKSIQTQERAITSSDYSVLLKSYYGEYIKSLGVFGGEELEPPQFGKVAISIVTQNGALSDSFKSDVIRFLKDKTPTSVKPIFINPEYLYGHLNVTVYYSVTKTSKSVDEISFLVRNKIKEYNDTYLGDFGSKLQTSNLSKELDGLDTSILGNTIIANPIIDYSPPIYTLNNPKFEFESELIKPYPFREDSGNINYKPAIKSSQFTYQNTPAFFQDDGKGNIFILSIDNTQTRILKRNVGIVNYDTGLVKLTNFIVDRYDGNAIKIYANTKENNIYSSSKRVFSIRDVDLIVNIVGK